MYIYYATNTFLSTYYQTYQHIIKMSFNKLDRSLPIFGMLEKLVLPRDGQVVLPVKTWKRKNWVTKKYILEYSYDALKYNYKVDELSIGLHLFELVCNYTSEYTEDDEELINTYEMHTIWSSHCITYVSQHDVSMSIVDLLKRRVLPCDGQAILPIISLHNGKWNTKKYVLEYDTQHDSFSIGVHLFDYVNDEELVDTYEIHTIW